MNNSLIAPMVTVTRRTAIAGAAMLVASLSPAFADETAEQFVSEILVDANAVFAAEDKDERYAGVETLVDKYVDMKRIGRFALGQYARQASEEQMEEYLPLFRKYATDIYQSTLDEYSGQELVVDDSVDRSPRDVIVNSRIVGAAPGDQYADLVVHWRVYRRSPGEEKIVDAGAQGVWLAIEQQSQFKSVISNNGGGQVGIDALIADLKNKVGE